MKTPPDLLQPRRSAHASIRGYLYQSCLAVLRWLELKRNEVIVFEGDEDIDRFILERNLRIYEQVKDLTGDIDVRHESVLKTLSNFLITYKVLREREANLRFVFTTTARFRPRLSASGIDVLADWNDRNRRSMVVDEVRSLLLSREEKKGAPQRAAGAEMPTVAAAVAWLDEAPERWNGFFEAVEWHPEAADLSGVLHQITDRLAGRVSTRELADDLTFRLVVEVLLASSQAEPAKRTRDRHSLDDLVQVALKDISGWRASPVAANLRAVFDESRELGRILLDFTWELNPETVRNRPGKLLPAYYEVVPFDTASRQEELQKLAEWCDRKAERSVWLLFGEGGSGKTRLLLEWCQRLSHNGWHAGFLDSETAYPSPETLQPLLEGVAPRLIVIDYAEQHPDAAQRFIQRLSLRKSGPKVRLVLLTRRIPDWWRKLPAKSEFIDDLLTPEISPEPLRLSPLFSPGPTRESALSRAVQVFAEVLDREPPAGQIETDLAKPIFDNALFLYMEALAIVYGDAPERRRDLLDTILEHERRFWRKETEALGLEEFKRESLEDAVSPLMAAITLLGEVSMAQVGTEFVKSAAGESLGESLKAFDLIHHLLWLLKRLCGSGASCTALQPDLLGERLIERVLKDAAEDGDPMLLTRVFEAVPDTKAMLNFTKTTMRLLLRRGVPVDPAVGGRPLEHGLCWLEMGHTMPWGSPERG